MKDLLYNEVCGEVFSLKSREGHYRLFGICPADGRFSVEVYNACKGSSVVLVGMVSVQVGFELVSGVVCRCVLSHSMLLGELQIANERDP